MNLRDYPAGTIRTYTGKAVDPLNLRPEDIDIRDIAHALSMQPRFAGHSRIFYSVAAHSVWVANQLPDDLKLYGLLHDASEAYLLDIPTPLKDRLPEYTVAERIAMRAVADAFELPDKFWHNVQVKYWDRAALHHEWKQYVTGFRQAPGHTSSKYQFIRLFNQLWAKKQTFSAV